MSAYAKPGFTTPKVGDRVVIQGTGYHRYPVDATVTKVARVYFTVEAAEGQWLSQECSQFRLDNGRGRVSGWAVTTEQRAWESRESASRKWLWDHGVDISFKRSFPGFTYTAVAEALRAGMEADE